MQFGHGVGGGDTAIESTRSRWLAVLLAFLLVVAMVVVAASPVYGDDDDPPIVNAGGPYSGDEGSAIAVDGTVTGDDDDDDDDGGPITQAWTYAAGANVDSGATCAFSVPTAEDTNFSCTDDGTYTVTLTATNEAGTNSDSATVAVGNVAPTISLLQAPATGEVGTAVAVSASFTDPGANDTHTCSIVWGEGSPSADTDGSPCTGSHSYTAGGMFTITVTVTDDWGCGGDC